MDISEEELYEGISVDYLFDVDKPLFGDLFEICGYVHPSFPPSGKFNFPALNKLQFSQVDDYFGIQSLSGEGDDVVVWLYPLVGGQIVEHNPGPFDGIRIEFSVLRNPVYRYEHIIKVCQTLEKYFNVSSSLSVDSVKAKISAISHYWRGKKVEPGSSKAMEIDY